MLKILVGATFEVKNPNAQSACGCGISVNFDVDKLDNSLAISNIKTEQDKWQSKV